MKPGRIGAEIARELTRPVVARFLAAYLLVACGFAIIQEGFDLYAGVTYHLLPLLLVPMGAYLAVRDRERGFAPLLATTPLTAAEAMVAKLLSLVAVVLLAMLLSVPLTLNALSGAGSEAVARNVAWFTSGLVLGGVSLTGGLLLGALFTGRATHAVSAGFLVVVAWFLLTTNANALLGFADSSATRNVLLVLLHLSPLTWAFDAVGQNFMRTTPATPDPVWGLGIFIPLFLALLFLVALRLQHVDGWFRPLVPGRTGALAAAGVVLVAGGGAFASWGYVMETPDDGWSSETIPVNGTGLNVSVASVRSGDDWFRFELNEGDVVTVTVMVNGTPDRVVNLGDVRLTSPVVRFEPTETFPPTIQIRDDDPNPGWARVQLNFTAHPLDVSDRRIPLTLHMTVDGEPTALKNGMMVMPAPVPVAASVAVAAVPGGALLALAWAIPRRLNR